MKKEKNEELKCFELKLPEGFFSSGNCIGCKWFDPYDTDSNGRGMCHYYDTHYYPRERNGCLSREV